jgi:hypothetical protein
LSRLVEAAKEKLARLEGALAIDRVWMRAALESVVSGQRIDPPIAELKQLTTPAEAWRTMPPWPAEEVSRRIGLIQDSHRLAIVHADIGWLEQLDAAWAAVPENIEDCWAIRARGEIGLALGAAGTRPYGWTADELELLDEDFLRASLPSDRVWIALAERNLDTAQHALVEYEAQLAKWTRGWQSDPEMAVRQVCAAPGPALHVELRALGVLVGRLSQ